MEEVEKGVGVQPKAARQVEQNSAANARRPPSGIPSPSEPAKPMSAEQVHWLKRIFQTLTLSNFVLLTGLIIAVPAALIAWDEWKDRAVIKNESQEDRDRAERATKAAERQAQAEEEQLRRDGVTNVPAAASPAAPPQDESKGNPPAPVRQPPQIIIKEVPRPDNVQAMLTRPFISLKSVRLLNFAIGEKAIFDIYIRNNGRPTSYTTAYWVGIVDDADKGYIVPSCENTITYGGKHSIVDQTHLQTYSRELITVGDMEKVLAGGVILSSSTYCYQDEITGRQYVSHLCSMRGRDGVIKGCPRSD